MNWDWDKLQQKRQQQSSQQPPKNKKDDDDFFGPDDRDDRGRRGGMGGGGGRGNGPDFGQFGDAFNKMRNAKFPVFKIGIGLIILVWLASGIFIVEPGEVGVVLRFGAHVRTVDPGPHYRLPYPIEEALTPNVHQVHRMEIGFSRVRSRDGREERRSIADEAAMLTKDENIVYVHFIVQYQIRHAEDFLFNADMQIRNINGDNLFSETVKNAAESAMRQVIGNSGIDAAVYGSKDAIQNDSRDLLQAILNRYHTGVFIQNVQLLDVLPPPEVDAAFKDLINAREDKIRFINEAGAYSNDIIPKARGAAVEIVNQANSYEIVVVQRAKGEANRFVSMVTAYNKAKDITRKRMYLEAMEEILSSPGLDKIIIDSDSAGKVLPYLPLDRLNPDRQGVQAPKPATKMGEK